MHFNFTENDTHWIHLALDLAEQAKAQNEVPVGAVIVKDNQLIGQGYNCPIQRCDPSAHAEILAMREAGKQLGNYRLIDTTLYVTLEPCAMCVGAILHARIHRLVFATPDPKTGAVMSASQLLSADYHNHRVCVEHGVLQAKAREQLQSFFKKKRNSSDL